MPTRKQRRRHQKLRRHEWEEVWVDETGRELPPEAVPEPKRERKPETARTQGRGGAPSRAGAGRVVQPPSWRRVARRALIFAPLMVLTVYLISGSELSTQQKIVQSAFLVAVFLPFSYAMDAFTYRVYRRRVEGGPGR